MNKMIKCRICETEIYEEAKACPRCGAPNKNKDGCLKIIAIGLAVLIVLIAIALIRSKDSSSSGATVYPSVSSPVSSPIPSSVSSPVTGPAVQLPSDEKQFIQIVKDAQAASRSSRNDMARGSALANRSNALRSFELDVIEWVGKVISIDSNSDGLGVLVIEIDRGITVQTWNNSISDLLSDTLIEPGSTLFNTAASLKIGQKVMFSGQFIRDDETGAEEQSLSLRGKLEEPEFTFRFISISGL